MSPSTQPASILPPYTVRGDVHKGWLVALFVSSLAVGCGPRGGIGDPASEDDSDDDAADDDSVEPAPMALPGPTDDVPCGSGLVDHWTYEVTAGQRLILTVDTIDADTTFDPAFRLLEGEGTGGTKPLGTADDDFECTYPPPRYRCPRLDFTAVVDGAVSAQVFVSTDCPSERGAYRVGATVDGTRRDGVLTLDDVSPP